MKSSDFTVGGQPTDPKAPAHPAPLTLAHVPFRGGFIEATQLDGEVWVPLSPLCEALGLRTHGQVARLKAKPWATSQIICGVGADGRAREMVFLDLRSLPLWLATIEPSRVKPEARPALVAYQREAAEVLYRHFLAPPAPAADVAQLAADVASLRAEVRHLAHVRPRPVPTGQAPALRKEDAIRVQAYCAGLYTVALRDVLSKALGCAGWGRAAEMAVAAELRALGYSRRNCTCRHGRRRWLYVLPSSLTLVASRDEAGGCA